MSVPTKLPPALVPNPEVNLKLTKAGLTPETIALVINEDRMTIRLPGLLGVGVLVIIKQMLAARL